MYPHATAEIPGGISKIGFAIEVKPEIGRVLGALSNTGSLDPVYQILQNYDGRPEVLGTMFSEISEFGNAERVMQIRMELRDFSSTDSELLAKWLRRYAVWTM